MKPGEQTIHKYLVQRSKHGDRKAQNELYRLYAGAMYNTCCRMLGHQEEARDVLQEAFVTAFLNINQLKNEITFSAWLKKIVVNQCFNQLRKRKQYFDELDENTEWSEEADNQDYAEYKAKKILAAMGEISDGCRTVMNLYLFEGYDHKEIGQILGITEAASKSQYSKAKSKIRKLLEEGL